MDLLKVVQEAFPQLLSGLLNTAIMTAVSLAVAVFLGLFSCLMGISKNPVLKGISRFYVWLIRGTPLLVQAFFVYFAIPQFVQTLGLNFKLSANTAGVITLSLNAGAYISELFRGGIQAVDSGQMEAARSLGLSYARAMVKVILPQALRISIPSLVNQFIITLKDTSIISVISFADIVYEAKIYIGRTMQSFATWTVVALMYLLIISLLSKLSRYIEKRLAYEKD